MIFIVAALVAGNVATQLVASRSQARLVAALMARTPAEYAALRRADGPAAKAAKTPKTVLDSEALEVFPIGL